MEDEVCAFCKYFEIITRPLGRKYAICILSGECVDNDESCILYEEGTDY